MRSTRGTGLVVSLGLLGVVLLPVLAAAQGAVRLEPVAEGVWAVRRAYVGSNAAVIVGSEGVVVVDSHVTPAAARDTLAAIREITDAPVRFLIDTHWHTDHSVGAAGYRDVFPDLTVISHHTVREDLERYGPEQMEVSVTYIERALGEAEERLGGDLDPWDEPWTEGQRRATHDFVSEQREELSSLETMAFALPDLTLSQKLTLHRPEGPIEVLYLGRGHTRGDVVAFLPEQRVLIAGDLVTAPMLYVGSHSRPSEWLAVLEAIEDLDFDHIIPGHGDVLQGKEHLELLSRALAWTVGQVRTGLEDGLGYSEIAAGATIESLVEALSDGQPETTAALERLAPMVEDAMGRTYLELTGRLDE